MPISQAVNDLEASELTASIRCCTQKPLLSLDVLVVRALWFQHRLRLYEAPTAVTCCRRRLGATAKHAANVMLVRLHISTLAGKAEVKMLLVRLPGVFASLFLLGSTQRTSPVLCCQAEEENLQQQLQSLLQDSICSRGCQRQGVKCQELDTVRQA